MTGTNAILNVEFMAIANHRKALRAAITEFGEAYRERQAGIIARAFRDMDIDPDAFPPTSIALVIEGVTRSIGFETMLDMSSGHAETLSLVKRLLNRPQSRTDGARAGQTRRVRSVSKARDGSGSV